MAGNLDDRRGILRSPPADRWHLDRAAPAPELTGLVAWYWSVSWDLRGRPPHREVTLPHVSSHLVVEGGGATVHGVPRRRFERTLAGRGSAVAVRFTAGGLAALLGRPLVDGPESAGIVPGLDVDTLVTSIATSPTMEDATTAFDAALLPLRPDPPDPATDLVNRAVDLAAADRTITAVGRLAAEVGTSVRTLQRLFAAHVGVSPAWTLRRYRLQEAAAAATDDRRVDWADLAARLGYSDQAHLVRDFTATFGVSPARYARDGTAGSV